MTNVGVPTLGCAAATLMMMQSTHPFASHAEGSLDRKLCQEIPVVCVAKNVGHDENPRPRMVLEHHLDHGTLQND